MAATRPNKSKRRKFQRPLGERRYKKLFVLSTEGSKTEPEYFRAFDGREASINCIKKRTNSSPEKVLADMKDYLQKNGLKKSDEAWLVVDKDDWTDAQLRPLLQWSQEKENYGFALSNPKFEFWLLLHFKDGRGVTNSQNCSERLKKCLPDYNKGLDMRKLSRQMMQKAIERARELDNPPCPNWPRKAGTTVYRLVENILASGDR